MVILLNQGIPFDVSGPLELFKNLNFAFMIPFLAAVFVASRSFVETKLTYNMFSRLIPALKSVLDARCNRERRRCRNSEEFNHHGMFIQLLPLFHVISIEKIFVCFCFFLACNRFNGLNFIVDCCVGLWSFSFGYANDKKTNWQFLLPSIGFLTADPYHKLASDS